MSAPELSVVCKSCGSEVSPYVTECPYCGTRLRKRAPKLERHGDEFMATEKRRRRRARLPRIGAAERPYVTAIAILVPAVLLIVQRAADLLPIEVGAIVGPVGSDWWRYLAAPWVYDDLGYLFVCGLAMAIFLPPLERRMGSIATLLLVIGTGALAAYVVLRDAERRADPTVEYDRIAVAVAAGVLLLLPVVEDFADFGAGIVGGLVGAACGLAAALGGRTAER